MSSLTFYINLLAINLSYSSITQTQTLSCLPPSYSFLVTCTYYTRCQKEKGFCFNPQEYSGFQYEDLMPDLKSFSLMNAEIDVYFTSFLSHSSSSEASFRRKVLLCIFWPFVRNVSKPNEPEIAISSEIVIIISQEEDEPLITAAATP